MLVSAVLDPSAFDARYFDTLYMIHAVDFLKGIEKNGLLIVDSEGELQRDFRKRFYERTAYQPIPIKYRQRLQKYIEELLLKKKSKRVISCPVSSSNTSSGNFLGLVCHLKTDTDTKADALIVGDESFKTLRLDPKYSDGIVPLSKYRDSDFEKCRQRYCDGFESIDALPRSEVDDIIIRSIRFSKWLRFYDPYIGAGNNTSGFREGIEYILSLWKDHGFFSSQQGIGEVGIFTCSAEQVRDDETDHAKESKLAQNQENYQKVNRDLIERLKEQFSPWWQIKLFVKDDPDSIFHARYLETQHAIIRVDRGFDLFKSRSKFYRNFFTLNMAESSHLRECRDLPDANFDGAPYNL